MKKTVGVTIFTLLAILMLLSTSFPVTQAQEADVTQVPDEYIDAQGSPRSPIDNHRVFLLGNSQVAGAFGVGMLAHITATGATYFARAGEPNWGVDDWWRNRHNVDRLFRRHHPTLVLIELGGNDFQRSARLDYNVEVRNFWNYVLEQAELNKPEGTTLSVCWISPATVVGDAAPIQPGRDRAARIIRETIGSAYYVESRDITGDFGRTADGIHFTHGGGMDWASRAIPRIEECILNQHRTR